MAMRVKPSLGKIATPKLTRKRLQGVGFALLILQFLVTICWQAVLSSNYNFPAEEDHIDSLRLRANVHPKLDRQPASSSSYEDVVSVDNAVLNNVRATLESASSRIEWTSDENRLLSRSSERLNKYQAVPLSGTVDRRPIIANRQMKREAPLNRHANGTLLGCAFTVATFVSNVAGIHIRSFEKASAPQCELCFQFSNREDAEAFLPGKGGYEPLLPGQVSLSTKCFLASEAKTDTYFFKWQKKFGKDEGYAGYGYPYGLDCTMPSGIRELTCRKISKMQDETRLDYVQTIYVKTKFSLVDKVTNAEKGNQFEVHSQWPWSALQSHDDDRRKIAATFPRHWRDTSSDFVPERHQDLKLAHVEGPSYDATNYGGGLSLKSMANDTKFRSKGGMNERLLTSLFHFCRHAPGSTHILAVVDGQLDRTVSSLLKALQRTLKDVYPVYGQLVFDDIEELKKLELVPIDKMTTTASAATSTGAPDITLLELLRLRKINILVVPIVMPSVAFENTVCGGQFRFSPYIAARYAADYHVMLYLDGDVALVEKSHKTLQEVVHTRFFSDRSSLCAGHRLRLLEQYVRPERNTEYDMSQCVGDLVSNENKWRYALENCQLKEGHIAARTDSLYSLSVHHPVTLPEYVPSGIEDCITRKNADSPRYFFNESEFVEVHLRNRERKRECACQFQGSG